MNDTIKLVMPVDGEVLPLSEVQDYLFSKRIIGEGLAINPKDNFIISPVEGEITLVYDTKHAIVLKTKEGLQILIHVGIDSVKLEGRGLATYVKVGDKVSKGDKLMFFDKDFLEKKASSITPIIITNPELVESFDINYKASKCGDTLLVIKLK
ncbi:PTS glucose transporter subunit IIA [Clostridium sp. YIM B02515]|uniref:PTS glucose transporter subunit IIA n=1 Tax=Clostridium rhizosphaerae TaxID=2803861 RepID=A0ABS1T6A3_9CLOT|nr:PTS glucose transporter subunit IIA [Clostridium rhizosphaerae]MBL4934873.1 PTS glucose transporter subunit IIA [Clostridium rhizosphaerae]